MDGHLFVPQLLREANKRVYRETLEKLGRSRVVDDRPASLSPHELVEAHPKRSLREGALRPAEVVSAGLAVGTSPTADCAKRPERSRRGAI